MKDPAHMAKIFQANIIKVGIPSPTIIKKIILLSQILWESYKENKHYLIIDKNLANLILYQTNIIMKLAKV
jgi:hypothetical protein